MSAAAGSNKAASMPELISFSASEVEELMEKLKCLPTETIQTVINWLQVFLSAKVKEEVLLSPKKSLTSMDGYSLIIEDEIHNHGSRILELRFSKNIFSPVLTKENIKGEDCEPLQVSLFDSCTGEEVKSGPGSSARVQIVVLEGNFDGDGGDWTCEEFDKKIVGEVEEKKSLLMGNECLNLINGTGCVKDIYFKSVSGWTSITHFRLGARLADTSMGIRVKEAITKPFIVEDNRKNKYKSHDIPSLSDEVWRLHKIGKKGPVNKRLGMENIKTVKDFLDLHFTNPKKLQEIFFRSAKNLENAVSHARTCPDKLLYCPSDLERQTGVVFNVSGQVLGLILDGEFASSDILSETEKDQADNSVIHAFKHWGDVTPFEDQKYLVRSSPHLSDNACQNQISEDIINEMFSDGILEFNHSFLSSLNCETEPAAATNYESIQQNIDEIISSIDAGQKPNVKRKYADIAFSVTAAMKTYKIWKMYSKSQKKPKLY